jgi:hypothetical protein
MKVQVLYQNLEYFTWASVTQQERMGFLAPH